MKGDPVDAIRFRLDLLIGRYDRFQRKERGGHSVDAKIYQELDRNINAGITYLSLVRSKDYEEYRNRYNRLLNGGDPA